MGAAAFLCCTGSAPRINAASTRKHGASGKKTNKKKEKQHKLPIPSINVQRTRGSALTNKKMTLIQKIILLLFTLHTKRALSGHSSKALFTEAGLIPDSSLYGHLVFPLEMEGLVIAYGKLYDIIGAIQALVSENDANEYKEMQYTRLELAKDKLQMLFQLTQSAPHTSRHYANYSNPIIAKMKTKRALFPSLTIPEHDSPLYKAAMRIIEDEPTAEEDARKRRQVTPYVLTTILGIGLGYFGRWHDAKRLEEITDNNFALTQVVHTDTMKIDKIENQINTLYKEVLAVVESKGKVFVKNNYHNTADILLSSFLIELNQFEYGILRLLDGKFSPALTTHKAMKNAFEDLVYKMMDVGYQPINHDYTLMFHSKTSVYLDSNGNINGMIHVPFMNNDKKPNKLYKLHRGPIYSDNNVAVDLQPEHTYVAPLNQGMDAILMTEEQFGDCERFGEILHCPKNNMFYKGPKHSCIYNLKQTNFHLLMQTCNLKFTNYDNHALQLTRDKYRLFSVDDMELHFDCQDERAGKLITFRGSYLLQLNDTCHTAWTPHWHFDLSPDFTTSAAIIKIDLSTFQHDYLAHFTKDLDPEDAEKIFQNKPESTGFGFEDFENRYNFQHNRTFYKARAYLTDGVVLLVLTLLIARPIGIAINWCRKKKSTGNRTRRRRSSDDFVPAFQMTPRRNTRETRGSGDEHLLPNYTRRAISHGDWNPANATMSAIATT